MKKKVNVPEPVEASHPVPEDPSTPVQPHIAAFRAMTFNRQMNKDEWFELPNEVKNLLVAQFRLNRSQPVMASSKGLIQDGYTQKDLSTINVDSLQAFTGLETEDFTSLLRGAIEKLEAHA